MKTEILLLFFINILSAIGYSLIAPLFPFEAATRGIKENMCGIVISIFAVSNFLATPFGPSLISKYGRKNIFYFATALEAINTFTYGLLYYIEGYNSFLYISLFSRFSHGIGSSLSATLVYSMTASLCEDPKELKTTIGFIELAWCKFFFLFLGIGVAVGPLVGSFFYHLGGYTLPFYICGLMMLSCIPFIAKLYIPEDEETEVPGFMSALFDYVKFTFIFRMF